MKTSIALLLLAGTAAYAQLNFSASGTFSAATPSTPYFGPNETWSLSFTIANSPGVLAAYSNETIVTISNVQYLVNGVPSFTGSSEASFYPASAGGGFEIALDINGDYFLQATSGAPQMFTGPVTAPFFAPAVYPNLTFSTGYFPTSSSPVVRTSQSPLTVTFAAPAVPGTPAPPSIYLILAGVSASALYFSLRRHGRT